MEDLIEDTSLSSLLAAISNSSKFKGLCKTIHTLRSKYLARGIKPDLVSEKILCKLFNTKFPVAVNWLSLNNTSEYHKIKSLVELDPKTIELALAIQQEIEKMKKKKKHDKQSKDYTFDDMLDLFQFRLESNLNLDKNSSASSSESPPSDYGENHVSPDHSGLSYYDQTKHNFNFEGFSYMKDQPNLGKRKLKPNYELEEDIIAESKRDPKKKIKVPYKVSENLEGHRNNISNYIASDLYREPYKREREHDNGHKVDKNKLFKL